MRPSAERPAGPVIYGLPVIRAVAKAVAATIAAALLAGCGTTVASHAGPVTLPRPGMLGGELYRPAGPGLFPAVIVLHGCSGIRPNQVAWAEWLRSESYAALVLDSFGGRGIRSLCGDSPAMGGGMRSRSRPG